MVPFLKTILDMLNKKLYMSTSLGGLGRALSEYQIFPVPFFVKIFEKVFKFFFKSQQLI